MEAKLVALDVLHSKRRDNVSLPYLYMGRGFSKKAEQSLRDLIRDLDLCLDYDVIIPIYTDAMRKLQSDALAIKAEDPVRSKELEHDSYQACAKELATQLESIAVKLSIPRMSFAALSAGASVVTYAVPMIEGFAVTSIHLFAPDPLPADAKKIPKKISVHLCWQRGDSVIPLEPNGNITMDWLGDAFEGCTITEGNDHEFDRRYLIATFL